MATCRAGGLTKLVIARAVRLDARPQRAFDAWRVFVALVRDRPTARCFYLGLKGQRAFVGASPETLWRQEDGHYFTHALAGTIAGGRRDAARRRLLGSAKDRAEHAIVVAAIVRALRAGGLKSRLPRQPQVVAAGALWHLETRLCGRCAPGTDAFFALAHLHPTPALGGSPPQPARELLAEQEPWRGLYGGAVGWLAEADSHLAVAIRSAVVAPSWACVFAGAGIVAASEPEAEWRETQAKLASLRALVRQCAAPQEARL